MSSLYNWMQIIIGAKQARMLRHSATLPSVMALLALLLLPATSFAVNITGVDYTPKSTNSGVLKIQLDGPAPKARSFTIDRPARLAVDLPGVKLGNAQRRINVDAGVVRSVLFAEAGSRTRLVVNMDTLVPYELRSEGDTIFITLNTKEQSEKIRAVSTVAGKKGTTEVAPVNEDKLTSLDFRRGDEGDALVKIVLSNPATSIDLQQQDNKIIAKFIGAKLPKKLERRLDVTDFATPVSTIDAYNTAEGAQLVIAATGEFEHLAYQTDNLYTIDVKTVVKSEKEKKLKEQFGYTGEKLSLNFQNIEVRAVLQLLADFTGLNLVASDSVKGNITLRLKNVPWDQALDIILRTRGLAKRQKGNVLLIAPADELAAQETKELQAQQQIQELAPLHTDFIQINYAKASDIAALLKKQSDSLLSKRGSVTVDERTNTLMILDTEDKLTDIRNLVKKLDVPVKQVMIESRIVIANDDFSRSLGVRWGNTNVAGNTSGDVFATSGSATGTDTIATSAVSNINTTNNPFPVSMPSLNDRLNVNLPSAGTGGSIAFAILNSDYLVDLELSALQNEGQGEVVSNPRVITSNQTPASIESGVEVPYQQASSSGATNVAFKKAVLSLEVTPQITPDERVTMDLKVSKDSVGTVVSGVPTINTKKISTRVLVNNGDTVVLGGIYEETTNESVDKVPLLGDIPFLGYFFRRTTKSHNKAELLIFVTPKILKDGVVAVSE